MTEDEVIAATQAWLDAAVIGLNLCPFAGAARANDRIRFVVSTARNSEALRDDLVDELRLLASADPDDIETTLLIHPHVLGDFLDFNDFLDVADAAIAELGLEGEFQVASFHPDYQFAGTEPDDVENCTNRSPYPTLHLLREESIDKAVDAFPETERIYETNMRTMQTLGAEGWASLQARCRADATDAGPDEPRH